jgi:hypothetical protein
MLRPLLCLHEDVLCSTEVCTTPHAQDVVTMLLRLMKGDERRTRSGLVRESGLSACVHGLCRCLSDAPWSPEAVGAHWQKHIRGEMQTVGTAPDV